MTEWGDMERRAGPLRHRLVRVVRILVACGHAVRSVRSLMIRPFSSALRCTKNNEATEQPLNRKSPLLAGFPLDCRLGKPSISNGCGDGRSRNTRDIRISSPRGTQPGLLLPFRPFPVKRFQKFFTFLSVSTHGAGIAGSDSRRTAVERPHEEPRSFEKRAP